MRYFETNNKQLIYISTYLHSARTGGCWPDALATSEEIRICVHLVQLCVCSFPFEQVTWICKYFLGHFLTWAFCFCREHKRKTFDSIVNFGWWQAVVLLFVGFLGGIFSAIAGSGVDICSFSVLSLLFRQAGSVALYPFDLLWQLVMFRISEKVSTPTSVVLMAINTMFGENISDHWRSSTLTLMRSESCASAFLQSRILSLPIWVWTLSISTVKNS